MSRNEERKEETPGRELRLGEERHVHEARISPVLAERELKCHQK